MNARLKVVPAEIRRVQEQFERWRADKQGRERIPPRLWEAAVSLCKTYSIHQVSRLTRLNSEALRERTFGRVNQRPSPPKPAFVEWGLPTGIIPGASPAEYVVEMTGPGGLAQRIHARGASVSEVAALARALLTSERGG